MCHGLVPRGLLILFLQAAWVYDMRAVPTSQILDSGSCAGMNIIWALTKEMEYHQLLLVGKVPCPHSDTSTHNTL